MKFFKLSQKASEICPSWSWLEKQGQERSNVEGKSHWTISNFLVNWAAQNGTRCAKEYRWYRWYLKDGGLCPGSRKKNLFIAVLGRDGCRGAPRATMQLKRLRYAIRALSRGIRKTMLALSSFTRPSAGACPSRRWLTGLRIFRWGKRINKGQEQHTLQWKHQVTPSA